MLEHTLISAFMYLLWIIPFIILGVILGELIIAMKFTDKLVYITKPITNFGHLKKECGIPFMTAFASPVTANSMLMKFYDKKIIEKRELIIASLTNSFPAILMHWKYILPSILPLLGTTGLIYFCVLILIGLIKTFLVLIVGRVLLKKEKNNYGEIEEGRGNIKDEKQERPPIKEAFITSLKNSEKPLKRMLIMIISITIIIFILIDLGVFETLANYLYGVAKYFPIPSEGLPIIAAQLASPMIAWIIAGNLLNEGILSSKDIVLALLIGQVMATIIIAIRFLVPHYFGIFGIKLGAVILTIATVLRTIITILIIVVLVVLW